MPADGWLVWLVVVVGGTRCCVVRCMGYGGWVVGGEGGVGFVCLLGLRAARRKRTSGDLGWRDVAGREGEGGHDRSCSGSRGRRPETRWCFPLVKYASTLCIWNGDIAVARKSLFTYAEIYLRACHPLQSIQDHGNHSVRESCDWLATPCVLQQRQRALPATLQRRDRPDRPGQTSS